MKITIISVIVVVVLIGGAIMASKNNDSTPSGESVKNVENINNVSIVDGKQIIEISAKGGYSPKKSIAKADIPTYVRFKTSGTFDCSSSIRISSLNILKNLPQTGNTDIDIGVPSVGKLVGSCGMGMYPFQIEFQK